MNLLLHPYSSNYDLNFTICTLRTAEVNAVIFYFCGRVLDTIFRKNKTGLRKQMYLTDRLRK